MPHGLEFSVNGAIFSAIFRMKQTMQKFTAKLMLSLVACTLVVPESYAKRLGGGRSVGRQAQVPRQRAAPPPTAVRPRPVRPPYAGPAPAQVQRRSGSPLGGMFGGALLGLGLGSVLGSSQAQAAAGQEAARREAERQEAARLEAERRQQDEAAGASGQDATSAAPGDASAAPPASGNW